MTREVWFSVNEGVLTIADNGQFPIWEGYPEGLHVIDLRVAPGEDSAFVLLDPPPGGGRIRNLIKVSGRGEVLWRGQLPRHQPTDAFVSFQMDAEGRIFAVTWSGQKVHLNPSTGCIEGEVFTK